MQSTFQPKSEVKESPIRFDWEIKYVITQTSVYMKHIHSVDMLTWNHLGLDWEINTWNILMETYWYEINTV